jgi:hypothetical protein
MVVGTIVLVHRFLPVPGTISVKCPVGIFSLQQYCCIILALTTTGVLEYYRVPGTVVVLFYCARRSTIPDYCTVVLLGVFIFKFLCLEQYQYYSTMSYGVLRTSRSRAKYWNFVIRCHRPKIRIFFSFCVTPYISMSGCVSGIGMSPCECSPASESYTQPNNTTQPQTHQIRILVFDQSSPNQLLPTMTKTYMRSRSCFQSLFLLLLLVSFPSVSVSFGFNPIRPPTTTSIWVVVSQYIS